MSGVAHADAPVSRAKQIYVPPGDRPVEALKSIVREYYDEPILFDVIYDENEGDLSTVLIGGISDIKGKVTAGKYFEHIDAFARRGGVIDKGDDGFLCLFGSDVMAKNSF